MDNEFILSRIITKLPPKEWLILEAVSPAWSKVLERCWRSRKCISIGSDLFDSDQEVYPNRLEDAEGLICAALRKCGPYLDRLHLAPVNVRKPFFRNVRRFTARHELTEPILRTIFEYCSKLETVDLSYHIFPTWASFELLARAPASLRILLMEICRLDEGPPPDREDSSMTVLMDSIFRRLTNLRVFSLWGSCYGYWTVTENEFRSAPNSLRYLDVSQGFGAKIGSLSSWIPNLCHLQQLHLERSSIDDSDLTSLVRTCRHSLRGLTLAYARFITDFSPIAQFQRLRYLRLDGNRDFLHDRALAEIGRSCSDLRLLSLENCNQLTSIGLLEIGRLSKLRHLSLCSILAMTDECLATICARCSRLSSLQLKYCKRLSADGLACLGDLAELRYLGVSGLVAFDHSLAQCVRLKCPKLITIEAFNCQNYT